MILSRGTVTTFNAVLNRNIPLISSAVVAVDVISEPQQSRNFLLLRDCFPLFSLTIIHNGNEILCFKSYFNNTVNLLLSFYLIWLLGLGLFIITSAYVCMMRMSVCTVHFCTVRMCMANGSTLCWTVPHLTLHVCIFIWCSVSSLTIWFFLCFSLLFVHLSSNTR